MKTLTLFFFMLFSFVEFVEAQTVVWQDKFDAAAINPNWQVGNDGGTPTYTLTQSGGMLKVDYTRTATSSKWTQFAINLTGVTLEADSKITIDVQSGVNFELAVKPVGGNSSDWLTQQITTNVNFSTYTFTFKTVNYMDLQSVYIYFDGGTSTAKSGTVYFKNFTVSTTKKALGIPTDVIDKAQKYYDGMVEGSADGQFPTGTKSILQKALTYLKARSTAGIPNLNVQNTLIANIYDTLMLVESKVNLADRTIIDQNATKQTVYLYKNLQKIAATKFLFGMHDANAYGINQDGTSWRDDGSGDRSDIKSVCGAHPAVFNMDFHIVVEENNPDYVRNLMTKAYLMGGVISMVWHQDNMNATDAWSITNVVSSMLIGGSNYNKYIDKLNKVAAFAKSMRGPKGGAIPILFRPYHEHTGAWFWWGKGNCTANEFRLLWQQTVDYLRNTANVHNFIYVISPDGNAYNSKTEYTQIFPGHDYVDIYGVDFYFGAGDQAEVTKFSNRVNEIGELSATYKKIAAVTEVGDRLGWSDNDALRIPNWYTRCFLGGIKAATSNKIAYAATWRNGSPTHHFAPYAGHSSVPDFINFYKDDKTVFLDEMTSVYDTIATNLYLPKGGTGFKTFTLPGSLKTEFSDRNITVYMRTGSSITNLAASFTVPTGAVVTIGNTSQTSGSSTNDFTNSVKYLVKRNNTTISNEFSAEYTVTVSFTSGINQTAEILTDVFPNPTSSELKIQSPYQFEKVDIFDISGRIVKTVKLSNTESHTISISDLMNGIYFLRFTTAGNGAVFQKKVVKN